MNCQDPFQELMKKRKQKNFDNNNDKLSHAWPRDPQQKWIQTLDGKPTLSPFSPHNGPPSLSHPNHMAWPINKHAEKETTSLSPLKQQ
jgi:hypothetical protein